MGWLQGYIAKAKERVKERKRMPEDYCHMEGEEVVGRNGFVLLHPHRYTLDVVEVINQAYAAGYREKAEEIRRVLDRDRP